MDIKFDEMTVDTSLAQKHLEEEKDLLEVYKNNEKSVSSINYGVSKKSPIELKKDISNQGVNIIKKLKTLVEKIIQNADLISQLEYLIRKIPIEDTKAQLNVICHHLSSYTPMQDSQDIDGMYNPDVPIYSDDPLLIFGSIKNILFSLYVMFHTTKATAYVAQLFVKLCHESGLESIKLEFTDEKNLPLRTNLNINEWNSGTVAVVSEDADVDSAVDKFLTSSKKAPWRLRKIIVQETIYQQFKDTLSWKCNLKQQNITDALAPNVMCAYAFTYDGRTFLIDPVEISKDQQSVTVEAYRTRKEMISFLQKDKIHYLSLWCNGIAEINEVAYSAYSTDTPVVWVNNLADFRGPPTISEAIFNKFDEIKIEKCPKIAKLSELSKIWQSKSIEYRRGFLFSVLDKSDAYVSNEVAGNIREAIADCSIKSFVDVGNDYVCIGKSCHVGMKLISRDFLYTPTSFKSLLYGNGLAVFGDMETRMFEEAGVPVISLTPVVDALGVNVNCVLDTRTRVIWTNSGTIFAN